MVWIEFNNTFEKFNSLGKNQPGTIIEILFEGKRKLFVIGDINMFGSSADGGRPFGDSAIVLKYQYFWSR